MRRFFSLILFVGCATAPEPAIAPAPVPTPTLAPLSSEKAEDKKWDVASMPGDTKTIDLDLDEGTWISLDLSPDGKQIVFDLLGDIYVMPVTGGEARPITSGAAWDMQPRFSPDGAWIVFISDRDGMDNVWLMDAKGGSLRPVTKDKQREMASPSWSPDGRFVVARKHITTERSLGAGELWLFHRSGGSGVMMTKRKNDQKDVGEPVFSPDGTHLYFSMDTTPGKRFEYNKNPHASIYQIKRLNPRTNRTEAFVARSGGACAPTPSHDGRWLAFVGRRGLQTALFLHDIASNETTMLYDQLDRDMQETWAVQGVYPNMAWTPKDDAILFWAGGKIRRVDVKSKEVSAIPFRVKDQRSIHPALRFPVEVHPDRFKTKMLRGVEVAPDGRSVVYQALGQLWIKALPSGQPRRLTADEGHFEQHASFSRDGRSIVFTTWSDQELGEIRVVSAKGGRSRLVTQSPGHFADPKFSPSGKEILFRKVGFDSTRAKRWTRDPGIYRMPAKGGPARLVRRGGAGAHYGATDDRVFFMVEEGEGDAKRRQLRSIGLNGQLERTHLKTKLADQIRVSPDGKWVAWRESYHAYVAPLTYAGLAFEVGPGSKALPVTRVSKDSGFDLHFSRGGRVLHWTMGPQLFSRDLNDVMAAKEAKPDDKPAVVAEGVDIGFEVTSDSPAGAFALVGGKAVTMKGDQVIENATIIIEGNRIKAVAKGLTVPAGLKTIDVSGHTVLPGFVDVHHHGPQGRSGLTPQANWALYGMLAFGTTTVHDPSHDTQSIFAAAELARAGEIVAPRIFSTGTILYGANYPLKAVVESLDDARNHMRRMKAVGAISVKSYRQRRRSQRQQVLTAAREEKMMVLPEGGSMFQHNLNMVVDGHTGIEHAIPIAAGYADVLQLWSQTGVGYTPTTVVGYGGIWGENYWYQHTKVFEHPRLTKFVPPFILEARARRPNISASDGDWNHVKIAKLSKKMSDAGIIVNVGAHGQREGLAVHWEMWMMVQGGMSAHEALRTGTLNGARYLGMDGDIGSIEVGKLADLAVVEGDVLADIRSSEKVRYTVLNGRVYDAQTVNQVHPERVNRPTFWFER